MRALVDTSVIVAAVVEDHPQHTRAFPVLEEIQNGVIEGVISAHSLAETYAVLTTLPGRFRQTPEQVLLIIQESILKYFQISALTSQEYTALITEAATNRILGGTIYDAVLLKSADKAKVDRIYTFNLRHFQAIASPEISPKLFSP